MGHAPSKNGSEEPAPSSGLSGQELAKKLAAKFAEKKGECEIDKLFRALVKVNGSDLHLKVDKPPFARVKGELRPLNRGPISDEEMSRIVFEMMSDHHLKSLKRRVVRTLPTWSKSMAITGVFV